MTVTIDRRFRGPASSGNGGYVAGLLADVAGIQPLTVTLRRPPPLQTPLEVEADDGEILLRNGDETIAVAGPADAELTAVPPVDADVARDVSTTFPGLHAHPFPECFVCGPQRADGDGMRLFPGRLDGNRTACVWTVGDDLAGDARFVWAALDCPGGWSAPIEGRPMVLGRLTAEIRALPVAGEQGVVMGLLRGGEGRKVWTSTTVYGADGRELGRAHATWIVIAE